MVGTDVVVDALDAATDPDDPPAWFEVYTEAEHRTIALVRHDDLSHLFGWVCPPECEAIGVSAGGWGRSQPGIDLDDPHDSSNAGEARRVRVIVVVDRAGGIGSRTMSGGGEVLDGRCRGGRLFDALQRCLGLPTDPPPLSSAGLIGDLWLAAVAGEQGSRAGRLSWPEVAALHPAARVLAECGHSLSQAEIEAVIRVAPQAWTWDRLRSDTVDGGGLSDLVAPDVAAWMDAGMFACWTLELHGDPRDLWGRAVSALGPDVVVHLADALDEAERAVAPAHESGGARRPPSRERPSAR